MIKSLRVTNFKCFSDQPVEMAPLTLLTGTNGMGKSTVLQALLLLRQSFEMGLLASRDDNSKLSLNGDLVRIGTSKDALYEGAGINDKIGFEIGFLSSGTDSTSADSSGTAREAYNLIKWLFHYRSINDRGDSGSVDMSYTDVLDIDKDGSTTQIPPHLYVEEPLFNRNFHYLHAERYGLKQYQDMSDFNVRRLKRIGSKGEFTAHFLNVFGASKVESELMYPTRKDASTLRAHTEAWMSEIKPGIRINLTPDYETDHMKYTFAFMTGNRESNDFRATNVGFGIPYSLPIVVSALSLKRNSLLIIENPEAHLHPRGQFKIMELLIAAASIGIQTIIESHSDHVLNAIRVAICKKKIKPADVKIHFFSPSRTQGSFDVDVISPTINGNGRIDIWPEDFFDEWEKSLGILVDHEGDDSP